MNTNKTTFDTSALRSRILSQYGSIDEFAKIIGMKSETLKRKLDKNSDFYHHEMIKIRNVLHLSGDEVTRLFFTPDDVDGRLVDAFLDLKNDERKLFLQIMNLIIGHPERREFALSWKGKMKDLPAALAKI